MRRILLPLWPGALLGLDLFPTRGRRCEGAPGLAMRTTLRRSERPWQCTPGTPLRSEDAASREGPGASTGGGRGGEAAALSQRTWMGATRTTVRMKRPRRAVELVATVEKQNAGMVPRDGATGDPPDGTGDRPARLHAGMAVRGRGAWLGRPGDAAVGERAARRAVVRLTLAFSGPAAARCVEPARCKLKTVRENQAAAGSAATPC